MNRSFARLCLATIGTLLLAFGVGMPSAGAASPSTTTEHHATDVFADLRPCDTTTGIYYRITTTYNSVEHESFTGPDSGQFTFTQTGTFTAVPTEVLRDANGDPVLNENGDAIPVGDPLPGETFTGKFTVWGGGSFSSHGSVFTFTFNVRGVGSEGTTFSEHDVNHITAGPGDPEDPNTLVRVAFNHDNCR
jgi:hypothetical protein